MKASGPRLFRGGAAQCLFTIFEEQIRVLRRIDLASEGLSHIEDLRAQPFKGCLTTYYNDIQNYRQTYKGSHRRISMCGQVIYNRTCNCYGIVSRALAFGVAYEAYRWSRASSRDSFTRFP